VQCAQSTRVCFAYFQFGIDGMKRKQVYSILIVFLALLWVLAVGIQQNTKYNSTTKAMVYITNEGYGGNGSIYDVKSDSLVIVTTYHLLQDSEEVMVYFPTQDIVPGKVLGVDEKHDVGFIEVSTDGIGYDTLEDLCCVHYDEKAVDELEIDDTMEYRFLEWNGGNVSSVKHKGKIGHTNWYIDDFDDYFIYNYCEVAPGMSGCAAVAEDGSYIGMMIGGVDNESGALSARTIAGLYESMR